MSLAERARMAAHLGLDGEPRALANEKRVDVVRATQAVPFIPISTRSLSPGWRILAGAHDRGLTRISSGLLLSRGPAAASRVSGRAVAAVAGVLQARYRRTHRLRIGLPGSGFSQRT
jgi:hypothetical protein